MMAAVALVAGGAVLFQQSASAAPFNPAACNTGSDYNNAFFGTTPGAVTVPSGATCNLQGATVGGSVTVQPGGRLIIGGGSVIKGGVTSFNAGTDTANVLGTPAPFSVIICNSTISSAVNVMGSASEVTIGGTNAGGGCGGNNIGAGVNASGNLGRVEVSENSPTGDCNLAGACRIGGTLNVNNNTGPVEVKNNKTGGGINCSGNGTISSTGNTSAGNKTGQCAPVAAF